MVEIIRTIIGGGVLAWAWVVYGLCITHEIEPPTFLVSMLGVLTAEYVGVELKAFSAIYNGLKRLLK